MSACILVLRRRLKIDLRRFFNKMVRRFEGLVFHKLTKWLEILLNVEKYKINDLQC